MAVEIKSGAGTDLATVDPTSKAIRVTNYASDGHEGMHSFPVVVSTNSISTLNEFVLPSFDAQDYKFISLQLTGTWEATVSFEGSNDNGTFYPIATTDPSANATGTTTATTNRLVKIPILTKYIRARVSAYTSGTVSATAFGHFEENSSGLISTLGTVSLAPETTKVIGTVNISSGTAPTYKKFISATTTNATAVSNAPANMSILHLVNTGDGVRFFKLYNKASAPVVGTDVPLITVGIPPVSNSSFALPALVGIDFSIGISFAITLGAADSDTTPLTVAANVTGLIAYAAL
tara:strand:+ start:1560 stop:2435 length:876 start_codon:yes stop_codon:yes gene_type:complete